MRARRRRLTAVLLSLVVAAGLAWLNREWLVAKTYLLTLETGPRREVLQVERVVEALGLAPGQSVADIGAGTGLFTRPIARAVSPGGVAYAVDVNSSLLTHIDRTAERQGIDNIRSVLAEFDDPLIPEPVDLVFICDTLHHIDNRETYLQTLRGYMRPGGRIAIIDFRENSPHIDAVIDRSMYYTQKDFKSWMAAAGFELAQNHDFLDENFFVIYECKTCPAAQ